MPPIGWSYGVLPISADASTCVEPKLTEGK
jgi:hypothetical protein